MGKAGAEQRGIEKESVEANLAEFEKQKQFPYQQLLFQRDMISGLPTGSVTNTQNSAQGIAALAQAAGGLDELLKSAGVNKGLASLLEKFGLDISP